MDRSRTPDDVAIGNRRRQRAGIVRIYQSRICHRAGPLIEINSIPNRVREPANEPAPKRRDGFNLVQTPRKNAREALVPFVIAVVVAVLGTAALFFLEFGPKNEVAGDGISMVTS